jgi:hypothetical protein
MAYIESYVWKTRGYYLRYPMRFLRSTLWNNRFEHLSERKELRRLSGLFKQKTEQLAVDPNQAEGGAEMFARQRPTQEQFAADLRSLTKRGTKLFFAYFGMETGFTHHGQFQEMTGMDPSDDVRVFFLGGADHILLRVDDRALLVNEVTRWLSSVAQSASKAA